MRDKQLNEDMKRLQIAIVDAYCKSNNYKAAVLSVLSDILGVLIGAVATTEEETLDGIDLAHKCIRTSATNAFVKKQQLRKETSNGE